MRRTLLAVALALAAAAPAGASAATLSPLRPCPDDPGFRCATLTVPLDRTERLAGELRLPMAVAAGWRPGRPLTFALTGGPGQPAVVYAGALAGRLQPLIEAGQGIAVLDQRGTGRAALRCPEVQRLRGTDPYPRRAVARCAERLGPARAAYTTADSVADLDDLRAALGAERVGLFGVSYGTHVALQYARAHPARTRALVLDSVLGPDGWEPFLLPVFGAVPRVLREQCAGGRCARDPVRDLAAALRRLPMAARLPDAMGRRRTVRLRTGEELFLLVLAGDLNPALGALLPAALAAAAGGDPAPLLRLRRAAQGPFLRADELSGGLLVATDCADARLPYALSDPLAARPARIDAALRAIDPARYAPFGAATVRGASLADDCALWPQDPPARRAEGPLPDVPALLLNGRLDLRSPLENARGTAALLPRATVVPVAGTGHDVLGMDATGCAARALARFAAGREVGRPCAGRTNLVRPLPRLRVRAGDPLRLAALRTVRDAHAHADALGAAGLAPAGGGLRAGRFRDEGESLRLVGYELGGGVRVSGSVPGVLRVRARGRRLTLRLTRSSRTPAG